jgi:hypothetical protein
MKGKPSKFQLSKVLLKIQPAKKAGKDLNINKTAPSTDALMKWL